MKTKIITFILCTFIVACCPKITIKEINHKIFWPKCFTTGEFDYGDNEIGRTFAIADGLMAFSNLKFETPPKHFGYCIIKMSDLLHIEPDEDEFIKAANTILDLKKIENR